MTSRELDQAVLGQLDSVIYTETGDIVTALYPHLESMGRTSAFTKTLEYRHVNAALRSLARYGFVDRTYYRDSYKDERGKGHNVLRCAWRLI